MKLKLIGIGVLLLSMVGLAGCFDEDYGPYGKYPGYYGYSYGPTYSYGWWGDGDWDDFPHYHHWDRDDWGRGWRRGHWDRDSFTLPGGGHELHFNTARENHGSEFARNTTRGFGNGARGRAFSAPRSGGGFHGGNAGGHGHRR